ncbi:FAD-dependent oxidoreductase [Nocardioides dubius]|uniref:FAD-dependent oxidoreductase n=1 Tax=Nocardioides dubius TaxID=317019 RepID=A0ABP4EBX3_9ACTN
MTRPRVVVAGLGDTGVLSAIRLARFADVVAISTKPGWLSGQELGLRLARPERWQRDYRIDFDRFRGLDGVRIVQGSAIGLDVAARTLRLRDDAGIESEEPYDALVIATGVSNGFWRDPRLQGAGQIDHALAAAHRRIASAATVAIVGGGPAAASTAAQVAERWPEKTVHLYFPRERALPHHHHRVWSQVADRLQGLGVALHPNHRAVVPASASGELAGGPIRWSSGQPDAEADAVVWAVGAVRPHTSWLPEDLLDEQGFVRVAPTLQVPGADGVFAVGDVAATDPLRTSARNQGHKLVAANVRAHLLGRRLRAYRPPGRRWGSVLGAQADGLQVFAPNGRAFRFPVWSVDPVLQRFVVRRGIYGGVRPSPPRSM